MSKKLKDVIISKHPNIGYDRQVNAFSKVIYQVYINGKIIGYNTSGGLAWSDAYRYLLDNKLL